MSEGMGDAVETLSSAAPLLWAIALVFFGAGDLATTSVGLSTQSAVEVGPLVAPLIREYGLTAMLLLKLAVFALCLAIWKVTPGPHDAGVPLGLAVLGVLVTGWNTLVLLA